MSKKRLPISPRDPLRLGFLPACDCAPLVFAHETGLFQRYGLEVELHRETSWAAIRDKVTNGDLDAAQAPATLPFLANVGVEADPCACVSGMVLSLQGNAITLSRRLHDQGVSDALTLREHIYRQWHKRTLTFGVVFPYSPAALLLRQWLQSAGIQPESDVRMAIVPPEQMFPLLNIGYLDGFAVEEPWSALAVQAGAGVTVADSASLAPRHPEKVLVVRHSFAVGRADDHERLVATLLEACALCETENTRMLADLLARPSYVNAPAECISTGLPARAFPGSTAGPLTPTTLFHAANANEPANDKAAWIMDRLYELIGQNPFVAASSDRAPVLKNVFRHDVYLRALTLLPEKPAPTHRTGGA